MKVLSKAGRTKWGHQLHLIECLCGSLQVKRINLIELAKKHCNKCKKSNKDHTLYPTWKGMRSRCNNKNHWAYINYGQRGIEVCRRWDKFNNFVRDMGPKPSPEHSIDRIDVNGNYEPSNCRWATTKTQNNNARSNVKFTYKGETLNMKQWADKYSINYGTFKSRIRYGWSINQILETDIGKSREL